MIDPEIAQFVAQQIAADAKRSQFAVTPTSAHIHNGIDSPLLPQFIVSGNGPPTLRKENKGMLYVNLTATTTTTRLYINIDGGTTWANFTASA
jgi:hypothetical protein